MEWAYAEMTGPDSLTLPPEAVKALGGAEAVTAQRERSGGGGFFLKPAEMGAPGAAPLSAAGALTLPPEALAVMQSWPAWNGVIGWNGRNLEITVSEEDRLLLLFFAADSGTQALRRRIAELGWTEEDINALCEEVKQERYERELAERARAQTERRKAV